MELIIAQSCPSCGAEIVLGEDDRLLRCPYCDVYNYRIEDSAPRYLLPFKVPPRMDGAEMVFVPYLRFKGTVYEIGAEGVEHRIVDTTRLGIKEFALPASLGLRPQAMRLWPLVASRPGRYILQGIKADEAFAQAVTVAGLYRQRRRQPILHRAFIGETLSRIYQPCYVQGGMVYDGVGQRPLGREEWLKGYRATAVPGNASWEARFISSHCPRCSGQMEGERDSLVLGCRHCRSQWQEQGGRFAEVVATTVGTTSASARYLPFWRLTFATEGVNLRSFGDYLRFTNQPLMVGPSFDALPLRLWIPAFKLNPKSFLQVTAQLSLGQWRLPTPEERFPQEAYPVNLSAKEAVQAVKTVLAQTTVSKKLRLPQLVEMRVARPEWRLVYVPFVEQGLDLIEERSGAVVLAAALRFGRKL